MNLAIQLAASILLIVAVTLIHGTGVVAMGRLFRYEERALRAERLASRELRLMVPMALCLFALHAIEIAVFAGFYLAVGAIGDLEEALVYSASAYTTLGHSEGGIGSWRLVGALEGLAGFLLIGWSAAVFVADMEKILRRR